MTSEELTATARELVSVKMMRARWILIVDAATHALDDKSFRSEEVRRATETGLNTLIAETGMIGLVQEFFEPGGNGFGKPKDTTDEGET